MAIDKSTGIWYNRLTMKYVIGLTGNIGSGKSTVLRMLERLGAKAIDADDLVHEVMRKGTPVWRSVVDSFGEDILASDGEIDRKKLGSLVFSNHEALERLEDIVHPATETRFREMVQHSEESVIAVEAVKIIDSGIYPELDALWLVTCPESERLDRLLRTRDVTEEDVKRRLRAQLPSEKQAALADVVIDNGGTSEQTWRQVAREWGKIRGTEPIREVTVRRASRRDVGIIAEIISKGSQNRAILDESGLLDRFLEWGYWVSATSKVMGVVGWRATNLVACLRDFYVYPLVQRRRMGFPLLRRIEDEARTLSCEAALLLVDGRSSWRAIKFYRELGYERAKVEAMFRPWREVAEEHSSTGQIVLLKKLLDKRIMVPL